MNTACLNDSVSYPVSLQYSAVVVAAAVFVVYCAPAVAAAVNVVEGLAGVCYLQL